MIDYILNGMSGFKVLPILRYICAGVRVWGDGRGVYNKLAYWLTGHDGIKTTLYSRLSS